MQSTEDYLKAETLKNIGECLELLASLQESCSEIDLDKLLEEPMWIERLPVIHEYFKKLNHNLGMVNIMALILSVSSK